MAGTASLLSLRSGVQVRRHLVDVGTEHHDVARLEGGIVGQRVVIACAAPGPGGRVHGRRGPAPTGRRRRAADGRRCGREALSRWMPAWMRCRTVVGSDGGSGGECRHCCRRPRGGGEHELHLPAVTAPRPQERGMTVAAATAASDVDRAATAFHAAGDGWRRACGRRGGRPAPGARRDSWPQPGETEQREPAGRPARSARDKGGAALPEPFGGLGVPSAARASRHSSACHACRVER